MATFTYTTMRPHYVTWCTLIFLKVLHFCPPEVVGSLQDEITLRLATRNGTKLSRSRRYLVFPEGSSFQLVFDLAYPTLDGIGLYVFGNTAAMAWELPSTPAFLDKKYHKKEESQPTTTLLPLEHFAEYDHHEWQPQWQLQKPGLEWRQGQDEAAKRPSVSSYSNPFQNYVTSGSNEHPVYYNLSPYSSRKGYPYGNNPRHFWDERARIPFKPATFQSFETTSGHQFDEDLHRNIHRRTRRELYAKIEELFSALISDGKSCLLKIICQVNKIPKGKGTLFEELLKTIFKVKPDGFYDEDEDHYDAAASATHNCDAQYPACAGNVFSRLLKTVTKNKIYRM